MTRVRPPPEGQRLRGVSESPARDASKVWDNRGACLGPPQSCGTLMRRPRHGKQRPTALGVIIQHTHMACLFSHPLRLTPHSAVESGSVISGKEGGTITSISKAQQPAHASDKAVVATTSSETNRSNTSTALHNSPSSLTPTTHHTELCAYVVMR